MTSTKSFVTLKVHVIKSWNFVCKNILIRCGWRPNFSHFGWEMTKIWGCRIDVHTVGMTCTPLYLQLHMTYLARMCETDWFRMDFWLWFRKFSVFVAISNNNSLLRHFWLWFRIAIYYFDTFGFDFEIQSLVLWLLCEPFTIFGHWFLEILVIMTSLLLNKTLYWFLFQFWTRLLFAFRFWFWFRTFCR